MKLAAGLSLSETLNLENLVERADGNPLFLEQLIAGLSLSKDGQLPDTIQGLVLARADRLPAPDRDALFSASALGQRFSLDLLRELIGDPSYSCDYLTQHRLLRTEGEEHVFCHALVREGLYASLVAERRHDLHLRAASVYADRDPVLRAQHLDLAGSAEAPAAYLAAARSEAERIRYETALQLAQRGVELASSRDAYELHMLLGDLQRRLGNIGKAIDAFHVARESASDKSDKCRALIGVAEGLRITESYPELLETLQTALHEMGDQDMPKERARICQLRGSVHFVHGETKQCLSENNLSLEFARAAGSRELEAQALGNLADAEFARGRIISAYQLFDDCVTLSAEHDLYNVTAANLSMRGQTLLYLGQPANALQDCEDALDLAMRQFNPRAELVARLVGVYALELYDAKTCYQWAEAGVELAKRLGAQRFEMICVEYLGRLHAIDGDSDKAEQLASEALAVFRLSESSMRFLGGRTLGSFALVCRDPDQRRAALAEGEELLKLGVSSHNVLWFYRDAIEVSLELGDWIEAERFAQCLEDYTNAEPLRWSSYFAARGRALAKTGRGDDATELLEAARAQGEGIGFTHSLARIVAAAS
jgi:tetratricopeptide (TPR) repeat protein